MDEPVELQELYFNWLCSKVIDTLQTSPGLTYWNLFKTFFTTEFVWFLSGDDNRAEDGKELRRDFLLEGDIPDYPDWRSVGCSFFEMLVAFSRRASGMTDDSYIKWFWKFVDNAGLTEFNDANFDLEPVEYVLQGIIFRTYDPNGFGGMFPITKPKFDQRTVEIWKQFCDYLIDQDS